MEEVIVNAQQVIYDRKDLPVRVRAAAWLLYQHEMEKKFQDDAVVLDKVLQWMDEQHETETRRRLEPTPLERRMLRLLICDGLTMKEIDLKTSRKAGTTKQHFKRMRLRQGGLTLYQLVALSVDRGWVVMKIEE